MRVVDCVSELTAGAARSTKKIQYLTSAHTELGSDPGTFRDVSTGTVAGNRCVVISCIKSRMRSPCTGSCSLMKAVKFD
jgi:hypothetical protein